jgi:hypothetical protein
VWLLWNYYHRAPVWLRYGDGTDTWTYTTATLRAVNNRAKRSRVGFVVGVSEAPLQAHALHLASNSAGCLIGTALDLDGFSAAQGDNFLRQLITVAAGTYLPVEAAYQGFPGVGFHYLGHLEISEAVGTTTWLGDGGDPANNQTGLVARIEA